MRMVGRNWPLFGWTFNSPKTNESDWKSATGLHPSAGGIALKYIRSFARPTCSAGPSAAIARASAPAVYSEGNRALPQRNYRGGGVVGAGINITQLNLPRIRPCPEPGEGVHKWLFYAASQFIACVPPDQDEELANYLETLMTRSPAPATEALDAIQSARRTGPRKKRKRATFDLYRAEAMAERVGVEDYADYLASRSPIDPRRVPLQTFLATLYYPGETVLLFLRERCQGRRFTIGKSEDLTEFECGRGGESGAWFLNNPVTGGFVTNAHSGKKSRRSKENVTSFRYTVIESDRMSENEWTAILAQLPLPIVSVTHSGGKSLHALVRVSAASEEEYESTKAKLRDALVPLGACESSLTSVRLTRMPGAFRAGREQTLLYFNPNADGRPIRVLEERREK